jgi:hypothetical protein
MTGVGLTSKVEVKGSRSTSSSGFEGENVLPVSWAKILLASRVTSLLIDSAESRL